MAEDKSKLWTKGLSCLCGLVLLGLAAFSFATLATFNPINIILPIYYAYFTYRIFGVWIIAAEFEVSCVLKSFRLLETMLGRGVFYFL